MTTTNRSDRVDRSIPRFLRHYMEMVIVMFAGMFILAMPADVLLSALGASSSSGSRPALMLLQMAVTMTVPMVAWMRFRGHAWRPNLEMAASMIVPAGAAIAISLAGLVHGAGTLMVIEHAAMLVLMLVAMLCRFDECAGGRCHEVARAAVAA
jgi:cation transport ATPase